MIKNYKDLTDLEKTMYGIKFRLGDKVKLTNEFKEILYPFESWIFNVIGVVVQIEVWDNKPRYSVKWIKRKFGIRIKTMMQHYLSNEIESI